MEDLFQLLAVRPGMVPGGKIHKNIEALQDCGSQESVIFIVIYTQLPAIHQNYHLTTFTNGFSCFCSR